VPREITFAIEISAVRFASVEDIDQHNFLKLLHPQSQTKKANDYDKVSNNSSRWGSFMSNEQSWAILYQLIYSIQSQHLSIPQNYISLNSMKLKLHSSLYKCIRVGTIYSRSKKVLKLGTIVDRKSTGVVYGIKSQKIN